MHPASSSLLSLVRRVSLVLVLSLVLLVDVFRGTTVPLPLAYAAGVGTPPQAHMTLPQLLREGRPDTHDHGPFHYPNTTKPVPGTKHAQNAQLASAQPPHMPAISLTLDSTLIAALPVNRIGLVIGLTIMILVGLALAGGSFQTQVIVRRPGRVQVFVFYMLLGAGIVIVTIATISLTLAIHVPPVLIFISTVVMNVPVLVMIYVRIRTLARRGSAGLQREIQGYALLLIFIAQLLSIPLFVTGAYSRMLRAAHPFMYALLHVGISFLIASVLIGIAVMIKWCSSPKETSE